MNKESVFLDALPAGLDDDDIRLNLVDLVAIVLVNWKLLVLAPLSVGLLVLGLTFLITPKFTARSMFLPPQQQQSAATAAMQSLGALAGLAGMSNSVRNPVDQYVALLKSVTVSNRIIDTYKLQEEYDSSTKEDARRALASNVRIEAGKKDGLITVEVDDTDPQRAAKIANSYVDELQKRTSELAITEAQQRRAFFERQLQVTKDKLTSAQLALQSSGITEGALRVEPKTAADAYASLKAQVTAAEVRLKVMRSYATEEAAEVKVAQSNLAALRAQLARTETAEEHPASNDYIGKYREFKYQEALFELFSRQFEMAKLDESREGAMIQVVDVASPPERKSKPRRASLALIASALGLVISLVFVFIRHGLRHQGGESRLQAALGKVSSE